MQDSQFEISVTISSPCKDGRNPLQHPRCFRRQFCLQKSFGILLKKSLLLIDILVVERNIVICMHYFTNNHPH